jgi:hypothetical protein
VAGHADIVLSADKTGFPRSDTKPARRRDPDAFLSALASRHPQQVVEVIDAMGTSLRMPLNRQQVLDRLAAAGVPKFAARIAGSG